MQIMQKILVGENTKINNQLSIWLITMFWIISIMIIVGGLTRLTNSGLSITEWELFKGVFPPLNETGWNDYFQLYKQIPQYYILYPNMTLDEFKIKKTLLNDKDLKALTFKEAEKNGDIFD